MITIKEAKKNLIKCYMQELKKINELMEYSSNNNKFLSEALLRETKRYKNLSEQKKEILTQLDNLAD